MGDAGALNQCQGQAEEMQRKVRVTSVFDVGAGVEDGNQKGELNDKDEWKEELAEGEGEWERRVWEREWEQKWECSTWAWRGGAWNEGKKPTRGLQLRPARERELGEK